MQRVGLILVAFIVAICTPWLIVKTDLNTAIHTLPGGWNIMLIHSTVLVHSARNHPYYFSLKDLFVSAAILILIGLILVAALREKRNAARGFDVEQPAPRAEDLSA